MGQCNYCSNQDTIKRVDEANTSFQLGTIRLNGVLAKGLICITYMKDIKLDGVRVYVHSAELDMWKLSIRKREKFFVEWYMELGTECEC